MPYGIDINPLDNSVWYGKLLGNKIGVVHRRTLEVVEYSTPYTGPRRMRLGPDGLMYVASGTTTMNMLPGAVRTGRVLRFDSTAAHPVPHTFARGLGMPNGMAFGADRALYVADGALGVLRIRPNGSVDRAWSAQTASAIAPFTNGLIDAGITAHANDLHVTFIARRTGRARCSPPRVCARSVHPAPGNRKKEP